MKHTVDFNKLFIFEMANNHMGDLDHAVRIIREVRKATKGFDFNFAFKLQYRDLDTFIHPDFKGRQDIKYVKRFEETKLGAEKLKRLKEEIVKNGFIPVCTPFDEPSVDLIEEHGFAIIKIGSCSFSDWPLLERVALTDKPLILSLGGAALEDMDKVVIFLEHRGKSFCLMHCVGEYPTAKENLQLNQIDFIRQRYPGVPVGYSTHEDPLNMESVKMAIAKGALVFERHVGVAAGPYALNKYSSTPEQIGKWLQSAQEAFKMCGSASGQRQISAKEKEDLVGLKRGVFARRAIARGARIRPADLFLAIPNVKGQLLADDLSKYAEFCAKKEIRAKEPVLRLEVEARDLRGQVLKIINKIKDIVIESRVSLPERVEFELSHHYGIDKFEECGAAIINCINREYCKKLIIMLPGQAHPAHYHRKKEETFNFLFGDLNLVLDGKGKDYKPGEMAILERGVKHSFSSKNGAIFEEISTTHFTDDSFYDDKKILENKHRKTEMTFWSDWLIKPLK